MPSQKRSFNILTLKNKNCDGLLIILVRLLCNVNMKQNIQHILSCKSIVQFCVNKNKNNQNLHNPEKTLDIII